MMKDGETRMSKSVIFSMHRFAGGGAERVTVLLANELARRGYDVSFLVRFDDGPFREQVNEQVHVLPLSRYGNASSSVGMLLALRKALAGNKRGTLFSISLGMSTFALLAKLMTHGQFRLIPVIHNTMSHTSDRGLLVKLRLMRMLDGLTYRTVVVSQSAKLDYLAVAKIPTDKVIAIYNPVVSDALTQQSAERPDHPWFEDDPDVPHIPVVVAAGRLEPQKNYPLMLKSLALAAKGMPLRLVVLGEGSQRIALEEQARHLGISNIVDFHGFANNPYAYFSHADCFAMSSDYEGLPTVMIEALACGCPVVSTDCPSGPCEILDGGKYGKLVPMHDAKALADAIMLTISGDRASPEELRNRAAAFSVQSAVERYVRLLEGE